MQKWFRDGFYAGAGVALALGIYLLWLWGAEHQVRLHTDHLLSTMESRDWAKFAGFLADDYHDQWGQDHARVLERTRAVFGYLRGIRLVPGYAIVQAANGQGTWQASVTIEGDNGELATIVKERVNALATPFTLEWRRQSNKPWDWKLVRVSNPNLEIPATGFE
ncbi:MAG TPA: hypothetical protein VGG94_05975 [Chthoniobacterales bacterium]|jgi:hypothetical protein